ncbi:MAG: hypothetical protein FD176_825 [Rhodospirillaceae bacterium]|nr:MAG: hypothetical protein FD176_825 [Rhodospirillaceae bacterium]TAN57116.1 MAG: hypothetical protein EPN20_17630 [Magnetospirillum sp.]TNC97911.1 MAG: hypothetical protein FD119_899 [Stygiobacter sp.]
MTTDSLIVTHTIALNGAAAEAVVAALTAKPGVKGVRAEANRDRFEVTYDLRHLRLDDVEQAAVAVGAIPAKGILNTIRRGWIRFTDENIFSSVSAPAAPCCNRPPGGK